MRIKLRLYPRDLDLLTLKQLPGFNLGATIRQALFEYVEDGICNRIQVAYDPTQQISIQSDQIDISLTKEKYSNVVAWLLSIRPGLRNSAVKAVVRSAISNPVLFAFSENSALIMPDPKVAKLVQPANNTVRQTPDAQSSTNPQPVASCQPTPTIQSPWNRPAPTPNVSNSDEMDLWEMNIENY